MEEKAEVGHGDRAGREQAAAVAIEHYADPWCWWSWGLEPVLRRLKEVYGEPLRIETRMAGVFDRRDEWLAHYGQTEDTLASWVADCMTLTGMPINEQYMTLAGVATTYPACLAVKAAQLQSHERARRFLRQLAEACCLTGLNVSADSVICDIAGTAGLDAARLLKDMRSPEVERAFDEDRRAMAAAGASFLWCRVAVPRGSAEVIEEVFSARPYEEAIDRLTGGALNKRTPVDILEYASRVGGLLCAREIAEVFRTSLEDAGQRLSKLALAGHFVEVGFPFGTFYTYQKVDRERLSIQEVQLSHVIERIEGYAAVDVNRLITKAVQGLYTEVATQPDKEYHFPLGRRALLFVGYPEDDINRLPRGAVESFAGVGYPHLSEALKPGARVLDIGSGSGTDVLYAAMKVGPRGEVVGLDITPAQIEKARRAIAEIGALNARIEEASVEGIPMTDDSVDVVTSNGVLNLVPDKEKAFREIFRVLKPGGTLQLADIVTKEDVGRACGFSPQLWADCIGGAAVEQEYLETIREAGFRDIEVLKRMDYFGQSSNANTRRLTRTFGAEAIVLRARKP